jgi:hypothetical protein
MTIDQERAMALVQDITIDEVRARAVMLVAANNVDRLTQLRGEVSLMHPTVSAHQAWGLLHRATCMLRGLSP